MRNCPLTERISNNLLLTRYHACNNTEVLILLCLCCYFPPRQSTSFLNTALIHDFRAIACFLLCPYLDFTQEIRGMRKPEI